MIIWAIVTGWGAFSTLYNPAMMSLFHLAMMIPTLTSDPFKVVGNIIPSFIVDMPSEFSAGASVVAGGASGSSSSSSSLRIWANSSDGVVEVYDDEEEVI